MRKIRQRLGVFTLMISVLLCASASFADSKHKHHKKLAIDKVEDGLSLMVLGSGAPVAIANGRASAGYMILVDGVPKILMDAGGGVYQRIADSGMNIAMLDTIVASHLHADHVGDFTPIVKSIYFHNLLKGTTRTAPIHFYGPNAAPDGAPAAALDFDTMTDFTDGHFDSEKGLSRYLHRFALAIGAGEFHYTVNDIDHDNSVGVRMVTGNDESLMIKAIGVPHGPVPALAFRIEYDGKSIVYSGDTSSHSANDNMITIAQDADLLIYDAAIMDNAQPPFSMLHTTPTRIGEVASAANVKMLLLSHLTPVTEKNMKKVKMKIRAAGYHGPIKVARDLSVFNLHDD